MNDFKIGDIVRCINIKDIEDDFGHVGLKFGKKYKIKDIYNIGERFFIVIDLDFGIFIANNISLNANRFQKV